MALIPYVIEKSGREERAMDIYSRLLKDRIVLMGSAVNDDVANSIVAQFLFLQSDDPKADVQWQRDRRHGHLRHDAVCHLRRSHLLPRAGGFNGSVAASCRRRRQTACPAQLSHYDPSAVGRHGRDCRGHHDPRLGVQENQGQAQSNSPAPYGANLGADRERYRSRKDTDRDKFMSSEEACEYNLIDKVVSKMDD